MTCVSNVQRKVIYKHKKSQRQYADIHGVEIEVEPQVLTLPSIGSPAPGVVTGVVAGVIASADVVASGVISVAASVATVSATSSASVSAVSSAVIFTTTVGLEDWLGP